MATNATTTAGKIRQQMEAADRSLKWTAERSGIAASTLARRLKGIGDFTVPEVARIAAALDIAPSDLLPPEFAKAAA